tara:strand:- start:906 stop:1280 length:375 start_codon:yes stop_codon:yes gene_type:complete
MPVKKVSELADKCPFAKDSKTKIVRGISKKDMLGLIHNWDGSYDVMVIIPKWSWFGFYNWCIDSMEWMSELDLTAVPDAQNKIILLQKLSELVEASDYLLENTDYYNESDLDFVRYRKELVKCL